MCNQLVSWATGGGDASARLCSLVIRYSLKTRCTSNQTRCISDLWHLVSSKLIGQSVTTTVQGNIQHKCPWALNPLNLNQGRVGATRVGGHLPSDEIAINKWAWSHAGALSTIRATCTHAHCRCQATSVVVLPLICGHRPASASSAPLEGMSPCRLLAQSRKDQGKT